MKKDEVANREPVSLEETLQDIDDVFVFNPPQTQDNLIKCERIQIACKSLAKLIAQDVPQGKEQTIAINNLLSTALFANHGILKRQIVLVAVGQPTPCCLDQHPASGTGS